MVLASIGTLSPAYGVVKGGAQFQEKLLLLLGRDHPAPSFNNSVELIEDRATAQNRLISAPDLFFLDPQSVRCKAAMNLLRGGQRSVLTLRSP
jgi:hypothetical protein